MIVFYYMTPAPTECYTLSLHDALPILMMTPALGLFYCGLVRAKNVLNTFMMSIGALGVVTIAWAVLGYSLAFSHGNGLDRKSTRLNSSHDQISYAVFCLKKKKKA